MAANPHDVRMVDIAATWRTARVYARAVQKTWTYFFGYSPGATERDACS
jgi:hypothetical protein